MHDQATTITDVLQQQVTVRPQATAIIDGRRGDRHSYAALQQASIRVAQRLQNEGLRPGDRVLLFQPMSAALYVVLLGLLRAGLVAMFVDPSAGRAHLERCCAIAPPRALIASPKAHLLRLVSPPLRKIPLAFVPYASGRLQTLSIGHLQPPTDSDRLAGAIALSSNDPALLTFTSGSTGTPKAALRTHGFLLAQHRALAHSLSLTADTVDLTTLPIFVLANLASGVTSLIPDVDLRFPGQVDGARVLRQIQQYQPISTAASPAFLARLAEACDRTSQPLPHLQRIFGGGAPVFPSLLATLQRLAPQAAVTAVYGSTEAEPIAHIAYSELAAEDHRRMAEGGGLLTGKPVAEIQLRVIPHQWGRAIAPLKAADFAAQCLPPGEVGEIVVSGDHVLAGYLNGAGDADTKFRVDGIPWHRTGDAGYWDEQGRVWLLGRCSARLTDERGTLYPFAVEAAAQQHPQIRRSALVQHQGKRWLLVEWTQPGDPAELMQRLAWAQLDEVRSLSIPVDRRHNAKIDYPALYRLLAQADGKVGADGEQAGEQAGERKVS